MNRDYIINDLINLNELSKEQRGCVKVFNYTQLNKTVYYYYHLNNKTKLTLDDFIAEAYYFIITNIDKIKIDYDKERDKYINYLNKAISNNYKALYNKEQKETHLYIEDVYSNNNSINDRNNAIEQVEDKSLSKKEYFPVDNTYNEYLNFLLDNKYYIFNEKEIIILNDIISNNFQYTERVRQLLKNINTTKYLYNHKTSLMGKINRRYYIYILLKEIEEDKYINSLKYIYKDKYSDDLINTSLYNNKQLLIQLLEYKLYSKEYFTTKYKCEDIYKINRLNVYMYLIKRKLYEEIRGNTYGNKEIL